MAIHALTNCILTTKPAKTSLLGGHFIYRVDTAQGTLTPSSANIVENAIDNPQQWGYNTHIGANGIKLRYNESTLSEWTNSGLTFYKPNTNIVAASVSSSGLNIIEGTINLGNNFSVTTDGTLTASNANITGDITATSLTIGSGSDAYDGTAAINISGYDIEIEKNGTDEIEGETVYLYPILYHNGERVPDIEIDYTHFVWYQDDSTIGTEGSATDGSYLATYGYNYRVVYDFADGAVGGGTEVQTRTVDPSKYITKISDTGITIHPEVWSNQSSYIQLDGNGMELFNSNGNSIAQYGSTARIGLNNSSRFLINNNSLEGYDNNNNKYFEVNSNGLSWGSNTAATVSQFNTLNNYIDTHLAVTSEGLVLSADNNTKVLIATGGTGHTYEQAGTYIIDGSDNVLAQFLSYGVQIGRSGGSHSVIDAYGQRFYAMDGTTQLANIGYGEGNTSTGGSSVAPYYTFGTRSSTTVGNYSVVEGKSNNATGANSHAEGWTTSATAANSHAEGFTTRATGAHSHAEGGPNSLSSGELISTTASGAASHAEGWGTKASGSGSHSQNLMTIAAKSSQTALGTYNIQDASSTTTHPSGTASYGQYAVIVGNGTSDARSNALTVDWNGQVQCQGAGSLNGTYNEIYLGDYSNRAKQIDSSLTTSSADNLWLTAVLKAICADYPNKQFVVFKGRLAPNSQGYFKVMIYDTSNVSGGMPQYAYGTWNKWQHTLWLISTNNYAFAYVAK